MFVPEEWWTAKQIRNLFSRMAVLQRQKGLTEDDISEEDIRAMETETTTDELRTTMMNGIALTNHPIVVSTNNVCELIASNKLCSLKLTVLNKMAQQLEVQPTGSLARKKLFYESIEEYAKLCPCMET